MTTTLGLPSKKSPYQLGTCLLACSLRTWGSRRDASGFVVRPAAQSDADNSSREAKQHTYAATKSGGTEPSPSYRQRLQVKGAKQATLCSDQVRWHGHVRVIGNYDYKSTGAKSGGTDMSDVSTIITTQREGGNLYTTKVNLPLLEPSSRQRLP